MTFIVFKASKLIVNIKLITANYYTLLVFGLYWDSTNPGLWTQ